MKKHTRPSTLAILLITTVSGAALLSACSGRTSLTSMLGDDREEQMVPVGRHAPMLNPKYAGTAKQPMPPAMPSAVSPGAPSAPPPGMPPAEITPFDRYHHDPSGRVVELPEEEIQRRMAPPPGPQSSAASSGGFFSNLLGGEEKVAAPVPPPQQAPAPVVHASAVLDSPVRKPLASNPQYSMETQAVAPVPQAPVESPALPAAKSASAKPALQYVPERAPQMLRAPAPQAPVAVAPEPQPMPTPLLPRVAEPQVAPMPEPVTQPPAPVEQIVEEVPVAVQPEAATAAEPAAPLPWENAEPAARPVELIPAEAEPVSQPVVQEVAPQPVAQQAPAPQPVAEEPAPASPMMSETPSISDEDMQALEPMPEPIRPVISDRPVEPPVSRPGFFSRMLSPFYKSSATSETVPNMAAAEPAPAFDDGQQLSYPELSSVPSTPEQFRAVKSEKQEKMEALQGERMNALQEQQALMEEPSVQQPPAPVVLLSEDEPTNLLPAPPGEEQLLGHVSLPPEAPAEAAPQQAAVVPLAPMPQQVAAPQPAPQPMTLQSQMAALPSSAMAPTPMVNEANTHEPVAALPSMAPSAAPQVMAASEENIVREEETTGALPSPQILSTVKMLPPSRYLSRGRIMQRSDANQ